MERVRGDRARSRALPISRLPGRYLRGCRDEGQSWYLEGMVLRLASALSLLFSVAALAQPVEFPKLTEDEKMKLDANGVIIRELKPTDDRGVSAESIGVIDAPSTEVWPVVRDCQYFAAFMPSTKTSSQKEEGGEKLCFDELRLPFPLANLWADTKSVAREGPAGHFHRAWSLVRGTYKRNRGSWTVLPWGADGKKSLVVYLIDSDPSVLIPDMILRAAQTGSLPEVFAAIRKRVVTLRAAGATVSEQ